MWYKETLLKMYMKEKWFSLCSKCGWKWFIEKPQHIPKLWCMGYEGESMCYEEDCDICDWKWLVTLVEKAI